MALTEIFLGHLGESARGELAAVADLERALADLLESGRAAWTTFKVDDESFLRHVAERVPAEDASRALFTLHADDLYLACACARGEKRAIDEFERRYLADVGPALARLEGSGSISDEVKQLLRQRLFVGDGAAPPKIADYSGRGPLAAWIRVAAIRTALSLRRKERKEVHADEDELAELPQHAIDPEMDYIKARYRDDFKRAFHDALQSLSSQERNVLRLHFLDGLNIDQIGAIYRVHRSTVARWIARCRESLMSETRRVLEERLNLTPSEFESLINLVQSQLDVSIHRFLSESKA